MTYCCEVFPKIAKSFFWQITQVNGEDYKLKDPRLMTSILGIEVNFCPSCGADIRGIVISKDEFDKLK